MRSLRGMRIAEWFFYGGGALMSVMDRLDALDRRFRADRPWPRWDFNLVHHPWRHATVYSGFVSLWMLRIAWYFYLLAWAISFVLFGIAVLHSPARRKAAERLAATTRTTDAPEPFERSTKR